jgi:transcriptional regulator with XRE-family HTH domain
MLVQSAIAGGVVVVNGVFVGQSFGAWLGEAIRAAGYDTQEAFGFDHGIDPAQVSQWVRDKQVPSKRNQARLAAALGLSPGALAARIHQPEGTGGDVLDLWARIERDVRDDPKTMADLREMGGDLDATIYRVVLDLVKAAIHAGRDLRGEDLGSA